VRGDGRHGTVGYGQPQEFIWSTSILAGVVIGACEVHVRSGALVAVGAGNPDRGVMTL
jgi:hypothetical protein